MKLWAVEVITHVVVQAETKIEAENLAESIVVKGGEEVTSSDAKEMKTLRDLPGNWDKFSIPYPDNGRDDCIGELLPEEE